MALALAIGTGRRFEFEFEWSLAPLTVSATCPIDVDRVSEWMDGYEWCRLYKWQMEWQARNVSWSGGEGRGVVSPLQSRGSWIAIASQTVLHFL